MQKIKKKTIQIIKIESILAYKRLNKFCFKNFFNNYVLKQGDFLNIIFDCNTFFYNSKKHYFKTTIIVIQCLRNK